IALFGKKGLCETVGYYGEELVLKAQEIGLNTCWVALTFNKKMVKKLKGAGEKLYCVIALGYGETQGVPHKSKSESVLTKVVGDAPEGFYDGVKAALLAPTAINQQKFLINCENGKVSVVKKGAGFYAALDLGIVKYHFEKASGIKVF
ncbi:MAG: nitroreductase, partial [Clostridia bacterium]|nr:nitroreductase [Clostridia bacterium]